MTLKEICSCTPDLTKYTLKGTWIGWPGSEVKKGDKIPESDPTDRSPAAEIQSDNIKCVYLTDWDYEMYYNGCCNATLWPLFHSMPERAVFTQ